MVITLENQHYIHYITQYSGNAQKIVKYNKFGEQQFLILTLCLPQGTKWGVPSLNSHHCARTIFDEKNKQISVLIRYKIA